MKTRWIASWRMYGMEGTRTLIVGSTPHYHYHIPSQNSNSTVAYQRSSATSRPLPSSIPSSSHTHPPPPKEKSNTVTVLGGPQGKKFPWWHPPRHLLHHDHRNRIVQSWISKFWVFFKYFLSWPWKIIKGMVIVLLLSSTHSAILHISTSTSLGPLIILTQMMISISLLWRPRFRNPVHVRPRSPFFIMIIIDPAMAAL